jgi:hypothetical protein
MHCQECRELISVFMDNELEEPKAEAVRTHLADCAACAKVCEDLAEILDICSIEEPAEIVPPNSKALWCRINNIIETEVKPEPVVQPRRRIWHLSLPQLATAVLAIAVISSLLTVVGIQNYSQSAQAEDFVTRATANQTTFEKIAGRLGIIETPEETRLRRLREQQAVIDYWDKRVQARREIWDANVREAFDRNLNEINEAVSEYRLILEQNPQDDISIEMLDSAMNEKIALLREFSDL